MRIFLRKRNPQNAESKLREIFVDCKLMNPSFEVIRHFTRKFSHGFLCNLRSENTPKKNMVFVKLYKKGNHDKQWLIERVLREYQNCQRSHLLFNCDSEFKIVKAICASPNIGAIVFEAIDNSVTFEDVIKRRGKFVSENCSLLDIAHRSGRLLGRFHLAQLIDENFKEQDLRRLKEYISFRAKKIDTFLGKRKVKPIVDNIWKSCATKILNIAEKDKYFCVFNHGDFSPSNLLTKRGRLYLIDFADSKVAPRYLDIAYFCCYLDVLTVNKPYFRPSLVNKLKGSFKDGYEQTFAPINESCVNFFAVRYLINNLLAQISDYKNNFFLRPIYRLRIQKYIERLGKLI